MPLHIDIRINERLIQRIHIARMTHNGTRPDSINEYSVVASYGKQEQTEIGGVIHQFASEPEEWEWDASTIRFMHRYGDSERVCLMRAIQALEEANSAEV